MTGASPARVLMVAPSGDDHADAVAAELERSGVGHVRIDTGAFPATWTLSYDPTRPREARLGGGGVLREVVSVWWRRPAPPGIPTEITDPGVRAFCHRESEQALTGLWLALDRVRWVNPPARDRDAHVKPLQLAAAQRAGLTVPATLVSSDPAEARAFLGDASPSGDVCKVFVSDPRHWRETRRLSPAEIELLPALRYAPAIFQRHVEGRDVRATVVGRRVFAARIDASGTSYPLDYRMDLPAAEIVPFALPERESARLLTLCERLGLAYGAADFRLAPNGDLVFLEINPAGQWLFVERATGLPISRAVADLLAAPPDPGG